jgi:5'-nucleotidase
MSVSRKRAVAGLTLAVAAAGSLAQVPASANPAGTGLVIREVYGGGGNTNATYRNDFVELYNPTAADINLAGMSVQYRSASRTGVSANVVSLNGTVPAGKTWLVAGASGGAVGLDLPTPDQTSMINMSGTAGQVYLASSGSGIDPNVPAGVGGSTFSAGVIDFVGYGTTATSFETAKSAAPSNTTSVSRAANGADSDNNSADFTAGVPTPVNCDCAVTPPAPVDATIAEIQGTDVATSPLAGQIVHTTGIVTATYPTGGFNGIYIQTAGTGTGTDATPGASDAVFVFGSQSGAGIVAIGDHVDVTGTVSEFSGTTELTPSSGGVIPAAGTGDPVTPLAAALPTTDATREAHEGELMAPTGDFTVTNTRSTRTTSRRSVWPRVTSP